MPTSSKVTAAARARMAADRSRSIRAAMLAPSYSNWNWAASRAGSDAPASRARSVNRLRTHRRYSSLACSAALPGADSALAFTNAQPWKPGAVVDWALVRLVSGSGSIVLGGLSLAVLAGSGAGAVLLLQRQSARGLMVIGGIALIAGTGLTLLAVTFGSVPGFFIGTVITGAGFGGGFQGAIRSVMPLAAPHQRAGMLSVVYVISYLAMGLPAVVAGFLLVHEGDLLATAVQYGAAVMVLAALALLGVARPARVTEEVPAAARARVPAGDRASTGSILSRIH
jgi:MFS family permease